MMRQAAGFYGKLPALGDFVQRGLPPAFIERWDRWLQDSLRAVHQALGDACHDHFVHAPAWRFVLAPGVLTADAWTGVLLPSCDRVGRDFPLTVALPFAGALDPLATLDRADGWFAALERLAREAQGASLALDEFEARLARLGAAPLQAVPGGGEQTIPLHPAGPAQPLACRCAPGAGHARLARALAALQSPASVWAGGAPHTLLVLEQLPAPALAVALLDGQWEAHGWRFEAPAGACPDPDPTRPLPAGHCAHGD
jgi:type VI secretion system protein ImpM